MTVCKLKVWTLRQSHHSSGLHNLSPDGSRLLLRSVKSIKDNFYNQVCYFLIKQYLTVLTRLIEYNYISCYKNNRTFLIVYIHTKVPDLIQLGKYGKAGNRTDNLKGPKSDGLTIQSICQSAIKCLFTLIIYFQTSP